MAAVVLSCTPQAARVGADPSRRASEKEALEKEALEKAIEKEDPRVDAIRQVWRAAAQASDWEEVALRIDSMPELDRAEPGTRYVRALAAHRLNDCPRALSALDGLAEAMPLLEPEIDALQAECQLMALPFEATASERMTQVSLEGRLDRARSYASDGQLAQAQSLLDAMLADSALADGASARGSEREVYGAARALRAEMAEKLGQTELATSDYRWLATLAVTPGADAAYERLSGIRLSKTERAQRAESMADRGLVAEVEQELARLDKAPGTPPERAARVRTRAWAYYRSRTDYAKAAKLYEDVVRLSRKVRVDDLFKAASAWSRSRQPERAVAVYDEIARRYPNSRAAEQALHSKANAFYSRGQWREASSTYTTYLNRYAKGRNARRARFVEASRYERGVALLARGQWDGARSDFEALRRGPHRGYVTSMLEHLEAVSLASSGKARDKAEGVRRFEQIVRGYPLSFAALSSAARLEKMGVEPPRLTALPVGDAAVSELPELPAKPRLLAELGLNSAAERTLYEEEPELRALYSGKAGETLCRQYESLDRGWRRYALAAGVVDEGILGREPTGSNIWAWQCLYPRPYAATVGRLEQQYQLPPGLIYSVMRQESEFRPEARSPVGAVGLMQLMPGTAERAARELSLSHRNERLTQAEYNLELGAFYLRKLLASFEQHVVLALTSYNAGPHAVSRWLTRGEELPLDVWAARIPYAETRNYVERVMSNWARYRYLEGGPESVPRLALDLPAKLRLPSDSY